MASLMVAELTLKVIGMVTQPPEAKLLTDASLSTNFHVGGNSYGLQGKR